MARKIAGWLHLSGRLTFPSGVAVGGLTGLADVDLSLARDASEGFIIPGTSLAGVLRAQAAALGLDVGLLFGGSDADQGASALMISDARFDRDAGVELRDHIGIDRRTGGGAPGVLFRRELISAGETAMLHATVELPLAEAEQGARRQALADLIGALEDGDVSVGASSSRGLGWVVLDQVDVREERLADITQMLTGQPAPAAELPLARRLAVSTVFRVAWTTKAPLMVKAGRDGVAIDGLPLTVRSRDRTAVQLILPGSSVKGRLRSLADYITRTVTSQSAPEAFLDQLSQLAVVDRIFGARPHGPDQRGARGAVRVNDVVLATVPMAIWRALADAKKTDGSDAELRNAVAALDRDGWGLRSESRLDVATHVAIDRWTGSSAGPRLYTALEPQLAGRKQFEIHVDPHRLGEDELGRAAAFLWLLLLREVASGSVGFGFGTQRGYGSIEVPEGLAGVTIEGSARGVFAGLGGAENLDRVPNSAVEPLQNAWVAYIEAAKDQEGQL